MLERLIGVGRITTVSGNDNENETRNTLDRSAIGLKGIDCCLLITGPIYYFK